MSTRGLRRTLTGLPALLLVVLVLAGCAGTAEPAATVRPAPTGAATPTATPGPGPVTAAAPSTPDPATASLAPAAVPAPTRVVIPALDVRSDLLDLGIADDGTAEVPEQFERAGWFTPGGRPGARGPTVVMGHVDSLDGPAVFADLGDLRPGDTVEVTVADGTVATYAVTGTETVEKDTFPTAAVFGATTADVLRLITCTGDFDRGERSYTDNLVVSAERVG